MWPEEITQFFDKTYQELNERNWYPHPIEVAGVLTRPVVRIRLPQNGQLREVVQFCASNFLGLADDPRIVPIRREAAEKYGCSSPSSRILCGTQTPHVELERAIANYQQTEEAALFFLTTVASQAAMSVMSPTLGPALVHLGIDIPANSRKILIDELSHNSLRWAALSCVGHQNAGVYEHRNMAKLQQKLESLPKSDLKMIVTDGVFSTDGAIAPLAEIVELARRYRAIVLVDDAHATGILGANGRGTWEHLGVEDEIDIKVGSLSKAYGAGMGGFVAGKGGFIRIMKISGNHFMFGSSPPPDFAVMAKEIIRISEEEPWRRQTVLANACHLRNELRSYGFHTMGSKTHITPVFIGDENKAIAIAEDLLEEGFLVTPFRFPAVKVREAIVRMLVSALHTKEQINRLVSALDRVAERYQVPRLKRPNKDIA